MSLALEKYLDRVMAYADLPAERASKVRAELKDHLEEKVARLTSQGVPIEDAVFQTVEDHGNPSVVGHALRRRFPFLDVRLRGTARGVVAIGPKAVGIFAFGGTAVGVFAFGGLAVGVVSIGGIGIGLLFTWAGIGLASFCYAGVAIGLVAVGGFAAGLVANGALTASVWTPLAGEPGRFSYYGTNDVPAFFRVFDGILSNPRLFIVLPIVMLSMLGLGFLVSSLLERREKRRLREKDPKLAE